MIKKQFCMSGWIHSRMNTCTSNSIRIYSMCVCLNISACVFYLNRIVIDMNSIDGLVHIHSDTSTHMRTLTKLKSFTCNYHEKLPKLALPLCSPLLKSRDALNSPWTGIHFQLVYCFRNSSIVSPLYNPLQTNSDIRSAPVMILI